MITIDSQTVTTSGYFVDIEIASGPTNKSKMFLVLLTAGSVGQRLTLHPFETWGASKYKNIFVQSTANVEGSRLMAINNNVFSVWWSGAPTYVIIREEGYL